MPSSAPTPEQLAEIFDHALDAYPSECCGFVRVSGARRCRNIRDQWHGRRDDAGDRTTATGYAFDLGALQELADSFDGDDPVLVVYHSHPDVGAYFSDEDARFAVLDGQPVYPVDHLVVDATADGARGARLFRFVPERGRYVAVETFGAPRPERLP
ncbi:Mov34/MPN/PAD-1 family protein [Pilimelia columellifera]|uniref:Mov34/MPN/PAD-1 family protein n=1 Tax=Pilimelia columellifera subsp. columellifera TaxID=706583 RepID=A0ABN3NRQ3_9ACTN